MGIRINKSGVVSGTFDLSAYPFTMLCYFQADESAALNADIFTIGDGLDIIVIPTKHRILHDTNDDLITKSVLSDAKLAISEVIDNNPIDSDFSTWWAVMSSIEADGITVEHNIWSGVGSSANLFTGTITANTLTGFFADIGTGLIGSFTDKFINVQEVVLVDRALTTEQLDVWAHGVPAPQANLPGNILFYQPLVTGYNEPTSVGTVGATGIVPLVVESVNGPLMFVASTIHNATNGLRNGNEKLSTMVVKSGPSFLTHDNDETRNNIVIFNLTDVDDDFHDIKEYRG